MTAPTALRTGRTTQCRTDPPAERAVIGALLADPQPPDHLYGLRATDFLLPPATATLHRPSRTCPLARPDLTPEHRDHVIAGMLNRPRRHARGPDALRGDAPDAAATHLLRQLVRSASVYRDLAAYADDVAHNLATRRGRRPEGEQELRAHNRRLAQALARHAEAFRPLTAPPLDTPDTTSAAAPPWRPPPAARTARPWKDQVLADLLRRPRTRSTPSGNS